MYILLKLSLLYLNIIFEINKISSVQILLRKLIQNVFENIIKNNLKEIFNHINLIFLQIEWLIQFIEMSFEYVMYLTILMIKSTFQYSVINPRIRKMVNFLCELGIKLSSIRI